MSVVRSDISTACAFVAALSALAALFGSTAPAAVAQVNQKERSIPDEALLGTPVTNLRIGGVAGIPPKADTGRLALEDPQRIEQGMTYFNQMNCVGCHAPNGAGGMGPSLSNAKFKYGGEPANIFLTIRQGRPAGMPAFGELLPDQVVWDLVAYIRSISKEPSGAWGKTISLDGFEIEQVPAQVLSTITPWQHTQPFSYGQAPFEKVKRPAGPSEKVQDR